MIRYSIILFFLFTVQEGIAQFEHLAVFPDMTGEVLIEQLVEEYKPQSVLEFGEAKDIMYGTIYTLHDSVRCVYTGHTLYLDPNADPSQYLYLDGSSNGINAEHTYPKSKGASDGNALSDLYNLYPTRLKVNADRGNLPFGEIPDAQSDFWYYEDDKISSIPNTNIDAYSEITGSLFEPREDHKGNVARSIFYFVTMYGDEVNAADPVYFDQMKSTLCDWHYLDPVDSLEWIRNQQIASYQSNSPNPFILDCSLAGRTYCDFIDEACRLVGIHDTGNNVSEKLIQRIYPNPVHDQVFIELSEGFVLLRIEIYDVFGNKIRTIENASSEEIAHDNIHAYMTTDLMEGAYIFRVFGQKNKQKTMVDQYLLIKNKQ